MWRAFLIQKIMVEFRSRHNIYVTSVQAGEKRLTVEFTSLRNGGSYYVTEDESIINVLKHSKAHGCYVYRETAKAAVKLVANPVSKPEEQEEQNGETIIESVTNISDAKEFLRSMGVPFQQLSNRSAILKKAEEMKITFPNLK